MRKKKYKIVVKNGMRDKYGYILGQTDDTKKEVRINVKARAHKDKRELASTIKHELLHVTHPKMTEKQVYKVSRKTKISPEEQSKLLAKLRMKTINYKGGAIKRKFGMGRNKVEPGALISQMNAQKVAQNKDKLEAPMTPSMRISIMGA